MDENLPVPANSLLPAIEAAREYLASAKSPGTIRAYLSDWRQFASWCQVHDLRPLPALPATVATYAADLARIGRKLSTITRRMSAIAERHRIDQIESPTGHPAVRATLAGIARSIGSAPDKKAALTADLLSKAVRKIPADVPGLRDRALILLGFAAALRRSELVALDVADIARHPKGIVVSIRKSKTDQSGRGLLKAIPHGRKLKVVEALDAWLACSKITEGPLFRALHNGVLLDRRIAPRQVARVVQQRMKAAGFDPTLFAGHSLRSGFITSAADAGADLNKIRTHAGHSKLDTTLSYMQVADAFKDHSGERFL